MNALRAEAWSSCAKTTVVMDDETVITGKRVIAECDTEESAALFAAAPELLAALKTAYATLQRDGDEWGGICDQLHAAIAKATGANHENA